MRKYEPYGNMVFVIWRSESQIFRCHIIARRKEFRRKYHCVQSSVNICIYVCKMIARFTYYRLRLHVLNDDSVLVYLIVALDK